MNERLGAIFICGAVSISVDAHATYLHGAQPTDVTELNVLSLQCDVVGDTGEKNGEMKYSARWGGIYFSDFPDAHWDGFHFARDRRTGRIYVVYHDGGDATETASDAYIDADGYGVVNVHPAQGARLTGCELMVEIELETLYCNLFDGHGGTMTYARQWQEMNFSAYPDTFWDAFYFVQNTITGRIYVVDHDGEPTDSVADAYIDVNGRGRINVGGELRNAPLSGCKAVDTRGNAIVGPYYVILPQ